MITQQQHKLLLYIKKSIEERGYAPSYDEMREALALKSKSGVHRLVQSLEERGFIYRLPNRARAVEVLRVPNDQMGVTVRDILGTKFARPALGEQKNFLRGRGRAQLSSVDTSANFSNIPLYGKIAAGTPIAALRDPNEMIDVPKNLLGRGEYYALTIEGDSMQDLGIYNADTAIIERTDYAEDGDIVVALIDGEEATLKKIKYRPEKIELHPANRHYKMREIEPERVAIQGRLRGLIRQYR